MKLTRLSWVARAQTVRTSFMQSFQIYCLPQRQQCVSQQKDTSWKCHMQLKEDGAAQALNNSDNRAWSGNWLHILQRCTFAFTDLMLFVCLFVCFLFRQNAARWDKSRTVAYLTNFSYTQCHFLFLHRHIYDYIYCANDVRGWLVTILSSVKSWITVSAIRLKGTLTIRAI